MADFQVTAFLDYSSALWSAQKLFGQKKCQALDPCALALAVCDELMSHGAVANLAGVHVYTSSPHKTSPKTERQDHRDQRTRWLDRARDLGVQVDIHDPSRNRFGEAKEVHTQLTVDLLKWAYLAACNRAASSDVAVLFSSDRQCRPAVLKVAERLASANTQQVNIAGWAGQERSKLDHEWIRALDPPTKVRFVRWESYEGYR